MSVYTVVFTVLSLGGLAGGLEAMHFARRMGGDTTTATFHFAPVTRRLTVSSDYGGATIDVGRRSVAPC